MPHTNRKKKTPSVPAAAAAPAHHGHTKRVLVDDGQGWTHVVEEMRSRGGRRSGARNSARNVVARTPATAMASQEGHDAAVEYLDMDLDGLAREVDFWARGWEESKACGELVQKIRATQVTVEGGQQRAPIDKVVCLGLGSLHAARREGRRASCTQLAALRTMMGVLQGMSELFDGLLSLTWQNHIRFAASFKIRTLASSMAHFWPRWDTRWCRIRRHLV